MPPILAFIVGSAVVGAAILIIRFLDNYLLNHQDKQEKAKTERFWDENQSLVVYYNMLKEKNDKLTNRREELRKKLADKVFFPDESTYFRKFEVEYQELYFKQEKVGKELIKAKQEIKQVAEQNNVRYPWETF